jgi:TPR repeat protein
MYERGQGLPRDPSEAAKLYRRSADQGFAVAQANLARLYDEGLGVEQDPERAARWYERAAEQKYAPAQYRMGQLFEAGRGVPRNEKKAAKWFRRAARNGHDEAQAALGEVEYRMYREDAVDWAAATAKESDEIAESPPVPERDRIAPVVETAEPGEPAELRARAEQGDAEAQFQVGKMFAAGRGVSVNMEESARWYLAAAEQGHAMAAYNVAFMYYRSRGVSRDLVQAYRWFVVAARLGVGDAEEWALTIDKKMNAKEREEAERILAGTQAAE